MVHLRRRWVSYRVALKRAVHLHWAISMTAMTFECEEVDNNISDKLHLLTA